MIIAYRNQDQSLSSVHDVSVEMLKELYLKHSDDSKRHLKAKEFRNSEMQYLRFLQEMIRFSTSRYSTIHGFLRGKDNAKKAFCENDVEPFETSDPDGRGGFHTKIVEQNQNDLFE